MKFRVIITTIVSFLLLAAVIAAGLNTVFTVTLVETEFSLVSETGKEEAAALKEKLQSYRGKSTTFLSLDDVASDVRAFPCLRLENAEKRYPSTVYVKVSERREAFAVANGESYCILDDEGCYLYDGENVNRTGGENIELVGFDFTFERGQLTTGEYFEELYAVFSVLSEVLGDARTDVLSIALDSSMPPVRFRIQMRQGVVIEIAEPDELPSEKIRAALLDETFGYKTREEGQLIRGVIRAYLKEDGEVGVDYAAQ